MTGSRCDQVHYPLFAAVGTAQFQAYEQAHTRRITALVAPLMVAEALLSFSLLLAAHTRQYSDPRADTPAIIGVGLLCVIWGSTALLQVPCHTVLSKGFDYAAHKRLVPAPGTMRYHIQV
jgi:hypothetical protein